MTEAHQEHDSPHEGPVKTPRQVILAVLFGFVVPVTVIVLLAVFVTAAPRPGAGSDRLGKEAVAERLRPVAQVQVKDVTDVASLQNGEKVYAAQCAACHGAGVAGAPKLGDPSAWASRVGKGYEALLAAALKGKGAMGPQGGGDFSDFEIGRAVVYMANKGGASFPEPQPPASAGGQAAAPQAAVATPPAAAAATQAAPAGQAPGGTAAVAAAVSAPAAAAATATHAAAPGGASAQAGPASGASVAPPLYAQSCQVCHGSGVAGAPKVGDKAAWAPRIAQGMDTLTASSIKGKGAMPPRGGAMAASDADITAVVTYMVQASK